MRAVGLNSSNMNPMKNFTFLRAIGCGLFGVLFLSPRNHGDAPLITSTIFPDRAMFAAAGLITSYPVTDAPVVRGVYDLFHITTMKKAVVPIDSTAFSPSEASTQVTDEKRTRPTKPIRTYKTTRAIRASLTSIKNNWAPIITKEEEVGTDVYPEELLNERIETLSQYARQNNYSTRYAFLVNLGMKSGRKRFFVIDLVNKNVHLSGLVAHGRGMERFTLDRNYSNRPGSLCSSLGFYKVGGAYSGAYGYSFKLFGLEKSNSNAYRRAIVLHSMGCIPDVEIEYPLCQSEGCPSVSPYFLGQLNDIIMESEKPILLYIVDEGE